MTDYESFKSNLDSLKWNERFHFIEKHYKKYSIDCFNRYLYECIQMYSDGLTEEQKDIVLFLIHNIDTDLNYKPPYSKYNILCEAIRNDNIVCAELLLQAGANPGYIFEVEENLQDIEEVVDEDNYCPYFYKAGYSKKTPLDVAVSFPLINKINFVKLLIEYKVDASISPCLLYACNPYNTNTNTDAELYEIINLLYSNGAKLKVKDRFGLTCLDWARKNGCTDTANHIKNLLQGAEELGLIE